MPAAKTIQRFFDQFRGLDKSVSDLSRPPNFADTLENCVVLNNSALAGRMGFKPALHQAHTVQKEAGRVFNYIFFDESDGSTTEELLLYEPQTTGRDIFTRVTKETITITYTGGATAALLTFAPNASGLWQLDITEDGSSTLSTTYEDGLDTLGGSLTDFITTIESDIDGLADFGAVRSGGGTEAACEFPTFFELDITNGAVIPFFSTSQVIPFTGQNLTFEATDANFLQPNYINANNALYFTTRGEFLQKYDGQRWYNAGILNPQDPVSVSTGGAGALTGRYRYHFTNVFIDNRNNEIESALSPEDTPAFEARGFTFEVNPSAQDVNVSPPGVNLQGLVCNSLDTIGAQGPATEIRMRPDGFLVNEEELPLNVLVETTTGVTTTTIDSIDLTLSDPRVTFGTSVTMNPNDNVFKRDTRNFLYLHADVNGVQAGVNTITVDSGHEFEVGDKVFLLDRSTSGGGTPLTLVRREITAETATTITIDGDTVDVNDNDIISTVKQRIYRTKADGNDLFFLLEIPTKKDFRFGSFLDETPDESLGSKYLFPEREPGPPPKCSQVIEHQGAITVSGDEDNPNTVSFSDFQNLLNFESFPEATNSFDVPFQTQGVINGAVSDRGILIVFKRNGRAVVSGDVPLLQFRTDVIEDGVGAVSHNSIATTPTGVIFLSTQGFHRLINGTLDDRFNLRLATEFDDEDYIQTNGTEITSDQESLLFLNRAIAYHDYRKKRYICFVPAERETPNSGTTGTKVQNSQSARTFVYDWARDMWSEWSFADNINMIGGLVIYENELYFFCEHEFTDPSPPPDFETQNILFKEVNSDSLHDFNDNTSAIDMNFVSGWDTAGEPSIPSDIIFLKTWQLDSTQKTAHDLTVNTRLNFDSSTAHSATTQVYAATDLEKRSKLKNSKARSIQFQFRNNDRSASFELSGWEYDIILPHRKDIRR